MVTLTGLVRTLTVSPQPFNCLPYQGRKTILFNNGWKLNLTFPQFREIRDTYKAIKNFELKQLDEDLFEVDYTSMKITGSLLTVCAIAEIAYRYQVTQLGSDFYRVKGYKLMLEGSSTMLFFLRELICGAYKADVKNKVVLDIGGFQGESAVHFWLSGAKKVVIYEPVSRYCQLVERNIALNGVNAELHKEGIAEKDGKVLIDLQFEQNNDDNKLRELIKVKNITDVIKESGADIAKFDCEKAEACLTSVSDEVLRKIPCYMLEIHSAEIEKNLMAKFTQAGFKVTMFRRLGSEMSIAHFQLI